MSNLRLLKSASLFLVIALLCLGILLRVGISTLGHNYDLESYQIVANLVINGQNVYANTPRYNYGPIWFLILGFIKWIQLSLGFNDIQSYHILIAIFLTIVDLIIATILAIIFDKKVGLIFFLCPVSILITGYHSQFDNLAILAAIVSWLFVQNEQKRAMMYNIILSAVLMGISLTTKHIMIFFPLWILVWSRFGAIRQRLIYVGICYGIFLVSFVPFVSSSVAAEGIMQNVFRYNSSPNFAISITLIQLFVPVAFIHDKLNWIPLFSGIKFLWLVAMVLTGRFVVRNYPNMTIFFYLISMLVWTTAMAVQYLAIPVSSCAVFWKKFPSWAYMLVATLVIIATPFNIGVLEPFRELQTQLQQIGLVYYHAQVWLIVLLAYAYLETINTPKTNIPRTAPANE